MKNSKALFRDFVSKINLSESSDEVSGIAQLVFEHVFGVSKNDLYSEKSIAVSDAHLQTLDDIVNRLNIGEPVQYILGEAFFFNRKFLVNSNVLIPRPETEELVQEVIKLARNKRSLRILDLGTGSGCIPVTLDLELTNSEVFATDVSDTALEIAAKNARRLNARVSFMKHDILKDSIPVQDLDVVVSNPPYITIQEKRLMNRNVVSFEPHLALFVPDDDPLIFYRSIITKSKKALKAGGLLAVEINEKYGDKVAALFASGGYRDVDILQDISGKQRFVKGFNT